MPLDLSRVPDYYHPYIELVREKELQKAFACHLPESLSFLEGIPESKWDYRYAEGKWSIKEVVQHVMDAERVFQYRALRFARKDKTELPGFDENLFALNAHADRRKKEDLLNEFSLLQRSSAAMFASFDEEQLDASGRANGKDLYVEGIGFVMIGHCLHHLSVIKERYL